MPNLPKIKVKPSAPPNPVMYGGAKGDLFRLNGLSPVFLLCSSICQALDFSLFELIVQSMGKANRKPGFVLTTGKPSGQSAGKRSRFMPGTAQTHVYVANPGVAFISFSDFCNLSISCCILWRSFCHLCPCFAILCPYFSILCPYFSILCPYFSILFPFPAILCVLLFFLRFSLH